LRNKKVEWDVIQNNSFIRGVNIAHLEGSLTKDALRASETKTSEL